MSFNNVNVNVSGGQSIIKALQNYNTVILKPNIVDNRNVLTQEMMSERHTKYVIRWNYSLEGATINIPEDCIIEFSGGTIDNGVIVGNNTRLIYSKPIDEICKAERQGTWIYDTSVADEEDITSVEGHLKFKDRPATDGMGKIILRKNKSFASQVTQPNTIYVIQYDFDLGGGTVAIPANCVLEFDGGSLRNGNLTIRPDTLIEAEEVRIFNNIRIKPSTPPSGTVVYKVSELKYCWFGELNSSDDCSTIMENLITDATSLSVVAKLQAGIYNVYNTINIGLGAVIYGQQRIKYTAITNEKYDKGNTKIIYHGAENTSCFCLYKNYVGEKAVDLKDIIVVAAEESWMKVDGFYCIGGIVRSTFKNLIFNGCRYGIHAFIGRNGNVFNGFSHNTLDNVSIENAIIGIYVHNDDENEGRGYITACDFHRVSINNIRFVGIYLETPSSVNSVSITDSDIGFVGYKDNFNESFENCYALYLSCQDPDASNVLLQNCYIENVIRYKEDVYTPDTSAKIEKYACINTENVNLTLINCRMSNTHIVVNSTGSANIIMLNCIDNGCNVSTNVYKGIIKGSNLTNICINGYTTVNGKKDIVHGALYENCNTLSITRYTDKNHSIKIENVNYSKSYTDNIYLYVSNNGNGSGLLIDYPTNIQSVVPIIEYANNSTIDIIETIEAGNTSFNNYVNGIINIVGNNDTVKIVYLSSSSSAFFFSFSGFRQCYIQYLSLYVDSIPQQATTAYLLSIGNINIGNPPTHLRLNKIYINSRLETAIKTILIAGTGCISETWVSISNIVNYIGDKAVLVTSGVNVIFTKNLLNIDVPTSVFKYSTTASLPSNPKKGELVYNQTCRCLIVHNGTKWVDENGFTPNIHKGTFAEAQALVTGNKIESSDKGFEFFATDKGTAGMPIYYGGNTKWYDATGTEVVS